MVDWSQELSLVKAQVGKGQKKQKKNNNNSNNKK